MVLRIKKDPRNNVSPMKSSWRRTWITSWFLTIDQSLLREVYSVSHFDDNKSPLLLRSHVDGIPAVSWPPKSCRDNPNSAPAERWLSKIEGNLLSLKGQWHEIFRPLVFSLINPKCFRIRFKFANIFGLYFMYYQQMRSFSWNPAILCVFLTKAKFCSACYHSA